MKKFITLFVFILSLNNNSAERCEIDGYIVVYPTDDIALMEVPITDRKFVFSANDWVECYEKALEVASENIDSAELKVTNRFDKNFEEYTTGYVYFNWKFNDGYIRDSKGQVSKYTSFFVEEPLKGDVRYHKEGISLLY